VKSRYWIIPILVLLVVVAGVAIKRQRSAAAVPPPVAVQAPLEIVQVDLVKVNEGPLARTVAVSGLLQALRQTLLTAEVEGRIDEITVRTGDKVSPGQLLAHMNPEDLNSHIAESRANLAAARAQLDLAERTQQRNEELKEKNFISANSLDSSKSSLDSARESLRAREAQLALAVQALPKATVRSPIKGIVAERAIEVGQHVGVNARLFSVVDLSELEFAAKLPANEIGAISVGQVVSLDVEGVAEPVEGRIERISPIAEDASRMIPLFVLVPNANEKLKSGMVGRGKIVVAGSQKTLFISDQALRDDNGRPWVLAVVGQQLQKRVVETGIRDESSGMIEIRSGLAVGEQVLLARVQMSDLTRKVVVH